MPDIEIYTQPWCPFCERAMHILTTKGVEFREIDAPHGSAARREAANAPAAAPRCRRSSLAANISVAATTWWRWTGPESWTPFWDWYEMCWHSLQGVPECHAEIDWILVRDRNDSLPVAVQPVAWV